MQGEILGPLLYARASVHHLMLDRVLVVAVDYFLSNQDLNQFV
jgi:hypothetical protein